MNNGLYSAFLGMRARQRSLEIIANNIANASTTGFKTDRLFHHSIEAPEHASFLKEQLTAMANATGQPLNASADAPTPPLSPNAINANSDEYSPQYIDRVYGVMSGGKADFAQGMFRETGRPLDVALAGDEFFAIQTPRGERYTRAGALTVDAAGQLVTQRGEIVVGQNGPITVKADTVSIGEDGSVSSEGQIVDQLKVVRFQNPANDLKKEGDALFAITDEKIKPQTANNARVVSGVLEMSNVNSVTEMAVMIQNSREFDSLQRSITLMMNDLGRKISSEIGKL